MTELDDRKRFFCNSCYRLTNHELKAESICHYIDYDSFKGKASELDEEVHENDIHHRNYDTWENIRYRFWVCLGCVTAILEKTTIEGQLSDTIDATSIRPELYPPRKSAQAKLLTGKFFMSINYDLQQIYEEVIASYNNKLLILCTIGLRALIEGICVDQGITDKTAFGLKEKLIELGKQNKVQSSVIKGLESIKFLGDDAAHRLKPGYPRELQLAIEILEALLGILYEHDFKREGLVKKLEKDSVQIAVKKDF